MNEKNYEYLCDQLLYSGFGETLLNPLRKAIEKGTEEFQLLLTRDDETEILKAVLNFSKSKTTVMYFLNSFRLDIESKIDGKALSQLFYFNGRDRYTLKEAYNLLNGRAVYKELTNKENSRYKAWVQLDFNTIDINGNRKFKVYNENYGFDLEKELEKLPIRELNYPDNREFLLSSLKRGNLHDVTFDLQEGPRRVTLEANPRYKSVAIYDGPMRLEFVSSDFDDVISGVVMNNEPTSREESSGSNGESKDEPSEIENE